VGIRDRIERPVIPGERRGLNKRVTEILANRAYELELEGAPGARVWAYRKAAWAIEDLGQELGLVIDRMGAPGLSSIPDIGPAMAEEILREVDGLRQG
jgi:DNA polymerase/3'-5' exonuclease PolX